MIDRTSSRILLALPLALTIGTTAGLAQDPAPSASAPAAPPAVAMLNDGWAEARLAGAQREGDTMTVRVRFYRAEGVEGSRVLYGTLSKSVWETDIYIVAGDKKYLLLKDSEGNAIAPANLMLDDDGPQAGAWYGTFPAPPAGEAAVLHLPAMEPLGPFPAP